MVCREYTVVDQQRVKKMEMAHYISYALGHPRTIGVSA